MNKPQVQIDEDLFCDLLVYFNSEDPCQAEADRIRESLLEKLDKLIARKLFTEYKTAPSPAEREAARQKYLDHALISSCYRSKVETSF